MELIKEQYEMQCRIKDDIDEHLPTLYEYAKDCESIVECGVRRPVEN